MNKVDAEQGTSYEFCGDHERGVSLADDFADFTEFMGFCVTDVEKARTMLTVKDIEPNQIGKILDRYTKEARRLSLDLTHEREARLLSIRHRLESELIDVLSVSADRELVRRIVDEAVPTSIDFLLSGTSGRSKKVEGMTPSSTSQYVVEARHIVVREVAGLNDLGPQGGQLLALIEQHGGK